MDYEPFKDMTDVKSTFMTLRPDAAPGTGSTYAHFEDQTTQRNRSGKNHVDKTEGMQPRTVKTIYVNPQAINVLGSWLEDERYSTRLDPVLDEKGKQTGRARVVAVEPFAQQKHKVVGGKFIPEGAHKTYSAGHVLAEVPYERSPAKGLHPVEIYDPNSPKGVKASRRGIHFGSKITEVIERGVERAKDRIASNRIGGGGGMNPMDIEKVPGKRPLKMAKGGMVDKAIAGNWKII